MKLLICFANTAPRSERGCLSPVAHASFRASCAASLPRQPCSRRGDEAEQFVGKEIRLLRRRLRKRSGTDVAEEGSPRREPWGKMRHHKKPRQGRQSCDEKTISSRRFAAPIAQYHNPRLTPWAIFYRCSAAIFHCSQKLLCAIGNQQFTQ